MHKRTLFVNHTAMLGGAELSLLDIVTRLKGSCTVVVFSDGPLVKLFRERGVDTVLLPSANILPRISRATSFAEALLAIPWVITGIIRLAMAARGHRVIYANSPKSFVLAALAGRITAKPVIWHLRDLLTSGQFGRSLRRLVVWLANHCAARVLVNSHATAHDFIMAGGNPALVRVVYNGIASEDFSTLSAEDSLAIRCSLGIKKDDQVVGMFSRLAPWKGQHVLLEALAFLPEVHAIICGAALFGEDEYVEKISNLTDQLGLRSRVHFLGFRSDIPQLTQVADIVVHASTLPEPFGRVIVEGMMAGKPVIATAGGGVEEIIEAGTSGLIVPPGNVEELVKVLKFLLSDPERAKGFGIKAKKRALEKFSLDRMLNGVMHEIKDFENN